MFCDLGTKIFNIIPAFRDKSPGIRDADTRPILQLHKKNKHVERIQDIISAEVLVRG